MKKGIIEKCALLPVNVIATALGFATLSNVWANPMVGFPGVRLVTMPLAALVWLAAIIKMTVHFKTFKADYMLLVPSSLYATFSMITMVFGGFLFDYNQVLGQAFWLVGVTLHTIHLCIFTYRFVVKGVKLDTFLPTWFVTYMGYMTAVVSGWPMRLAETPFQPLMLPILQWVMFYGFIVYPIVVLGMLVRLSKKPIPVILKPTGAIFLAPTSLFFISYLNMHSLFNLPQQTHHAIIVAAYIAVFITLIRVGTLLVSYLRGPFAPGLAALTFPTAIAAVATMRMVMYLNGIEGLEGAATLLGHFFGVQLFITTAIMVYIGFSFLLAFLDSCKSSPKASSDYSAAKLN